MSVSRLSIKANTVAKQKTLARSKESFDALFLTEDLREVQNLDLRTLATTINQNPRKAGAIKQLEEEKALKAMKRQEEYRLRSRNLVLNSKSLPSRNPYPQTENITCPVERVFEELKVEQELLQSETRPKKLYQLQHVQNDERNELPRPLKYVKSTSLNQPFLKMHMMKNQMHDIQREKASSLVKNITFSKEIQKFNPFFNHKPEPIPPTAYTHDFQIEMGQKTEGSQPLEEINTEEEGLMRKALQRKLSFQQAEESQAKINLLAHRILPPKFYDSFKDLQDQGLLLTSAPKIPVKKKTLRTIENEEVAFQNQLRASPSKLREFRSLVDKIKKRKQPIDLSNKQVRTREPLLIQENIDSVQEQTQSLTIDEDVGIDDSLPEASKEPKLSPLDIGGDPTQSTRLGEGESHTLDEPSRDHPQDLNCTPDNTLGSLENSASRDSLPRVKPKRVKIPKTSKKAKAFKFSSKKTTTMGSRANSACINIQTAQAKMAETPNKLHFVDDPPSAYQAGQDSGTARTPAWKAELKRRQTILLTNLELEKKQDGLGSSVSLPQIPLYRPSRVSPLDEKALEKTKWMAAQMREIPQVKLKKIFCNKVQELNKMIKDREINNFDSAHFDYLHLGKPQPSARKDVSGRSEMSVYSKKEQEAYERQIERESMIEDLLLRKYMIKQQLSLIQLPKTDEEKEKEVANVLSSLRRQVVNSMSPVKRPRAPGEEVHKGDLKKSSLLSYLRSEIDPEYTADRIAKEGKRSKVIQDLLIEMSKKNEKGVFEQIAGRPNAYEKGVDQQQRLLDEKMLAPSFPGYSANRERFEMQRSRVENIYQTATENSGDLVSLKGRFVMSEIEAVQRHLKQLEEETDHEVRNLMMGHNSKQYYNQMFDEKIKLWQKNGIKEIDYNFQKQHYLGIKNSQKLKYQLRNLNNSID